MNRDNEEPGRNIPLCRVVVARRSAYPDPLVVGAGEEVAVSANDTTWPGFVWCTTRRGKGGWVPAAYIERRGATGTLLRDYDATELTVEVGEELAIHGEAAGWLWCANRAGQRGWVPAENVTMP